MKLCFYIFFYCFAYFGMFLKGLSQDIKFKHYSLEEGLTHNVAYDIHQDKNGYLWFGMDNGLSRFDGINFKHYTEEDGLNGPYVITLSEDHKGSIWTGTHLKGINYVEGDTVKKLEVPRLFIDANIVHHSKGDLILTENTQRVGGRANNLIARHKNGLPHDSISMFYLYEEQAKLAWSELNFDLDDENSLGEAYDALRGKDKQAIFVKLRQLTNGDVLLLTPFGLYQYDPIKFFSPFFPSHLPPIAYLEIDEDLEGNVWLLSDKKLYCLAEDGSLSTFPLAKELIGSIQFKVISKRKIILLSESRDKLWVLDLKSGHFRDIAPNFNLLSVISYIEKDNESSLWFTTMGDGVFCVFEHEFNSYSSFAGLSSSYVNNIREDLDGSILLCTENGLDRIKDGSVRKENWFDKQILPLSPGKKRVKDIFPITNSSYLASINGYSYLLSPLESRGTRIGTYPVVRFRTFHNDSLVLISNGKSLQERRFDFYHIQKQKVGRSIHLEIDKVGSNLSVYPDHKANAYWLNPENGLLLFEGDSLRNFPIPEGIPAEVNIKQITSGPAGNIWFASEKGILRYDGNQLIWHSEKEGWPIFSCRQILFDKKENMWMATPEGLYCWRKGKLVRYKNYGLDIRSLMIDRKNRLWIGTSAGAISLNLANFPFESEAPLLTIEELSIDAQTFSTNELKEISENQSLHLRYCAISFIDPQNIEYAYRLNDDNAWQFTSNRSLDFNNLQAGEYQLRIKARKFNSDWSEAKQINFVVRAPWYKSWWALIVGGISFFGLLLAVGYLWGNYTKSKIEAENKLAIEMSQLKLQALQSQLNPHFIFNALNVIQGYVLKHDISSSNLYLSQFSNLMRRFLESSKQNEILLAEEIELLNLFVEMEQLCYRDRFNYELEISLDIDPLNVSIPSMLIQPFVENAIHHGLLQKEGHGNLKVSFEQNGRKMKCKIEDDGIGREKAREIQARSRLNRNSRGMQIVSERVSMQNLSAKNEIDIRIVDKKNSEGVARGTLVEISWSLSHQ